jgi:hypothetical protein
VGSRHRRKGGRVTPKGTRPRHSGPGPAAVSVMPAGLDELLPRFDDELAVFRDAEAASFVSLFSAESRPSNVIDLRPTDDQPPSAGEVLDVLGDLGPRPPQRVVDTVAAFATYGGAAATEARKTLGSFARQPSAAASGFGQGTVTSTMVIEDVFGETTQYLFGLSYPDGSEGAVALLIDKLLGGIVKDTVVMNDVATFTDLADDNDEVDYRPGNVNQAAAAIDDAYAMNDRTIGIDEMVDDDVAAVRPLVEKVLAPVSREWVEHEPVPAEVRSGLVNEFLGWAHETHPTVSDDVLSWSSSAIDFAADRGTGDPLKWSPNSVVGFLQWSSDKIMAAPDELRQIPEMLAIFLPWAHTRAGWGDRYLDQALDAIDRVLPLFEEVISGSAARSPVQQVVREALAGVDLDDPDAISAAIERYNLGLELPGLGLEVPALTVPPVGGSHPEPFDPSGTGAAAESATRVAELASVSARAIFDDEYVTLVRRLTADAARADPALFARGRADIWAAGVVYAVAQLNDIIGGWGPMSMFSDELVSRLAGAPGTITSKAAAIRSAVGEQRWSLNPRFQHSGAHFDLTDSGYGFGSRGFGGGDGLGRGGATGGSLAEYEPPPPVIAYDRLPAGSAFVLRCELVDLPVWRTVRVPASATLFELHRVLQRVFDWDDYHLHLFTVGRHRYTADPDPDWAPGLEEDRDDTQVRLDELVRPGAVFDYVYDFGDNWEMRIRVEELLEPGPGSDRLELLDGAGDAPPEDCGGTWGYNDLIAALSDPNHPDHAELSTWAGDFRPGSFDLETTATRLRD